jgi:hypothetical protein
LNLGRLRLAALGLLGLAALGAAMFATAVALIGLARFVYRRLLHGDPGDAYLASALLFGLAAVVVGALWLLCRRVVVQHRSGPGRLVAHAYGAIAIALGLTTSAVGMFNVAQDVAASLQAGVTYLAAIVVDAIVATVGLTVLAFHWWSLRQPVSAR